MAANHDVRLKRVSHALNPIYKYRYMRHVMISRYAVRAVGASPKHALRVCIHAHRHQELMEQLENTTQELHETTERLRTADAERIAANKAMEGMRLQLMDLDAQHKGLQAGLRQRCAHETRGAAVFIIARLARGLSDLSRICSRTCM